MIDDTSDAGLPASDAQPTKTRTFFDDEGMLWRVYEVPLSNYDRRSGLSLVFSSDGVMRRVRNFPVDWHTLSDIELAALSWQS